jgi:hypothetical protein
LTFILADLVPEEAMAVVMAVEPLLAWFICSSEKSPVSKPANDTNEVTGGAVVEVVVDVGAAVVDVVVL